MFTRCREGDHDLLAAFASDSASSSPSQIEHGFAHEGGVCGRGTKAVPLVADLQCRKRSASRRLVFSSSVHRFLNLHPKRWGGWPIPHSLLETRQRVRRVLGTREVHPRDWAMRMPVGFQGRRLRRHCRRRGCAGEGLRATIPQEQVLRRSRFLLSGPPPARAHSSKPRDLPRRLRGRSSFRDPGAFVVPQARPRP